MMQKPVLLATVRLLLLVVCAYSSHSAFTAVTLHIQLLQRIYSASQQSQRNYSSHRAIAAVKPHSQQIATVTAILKQPQHITAVTKHLQQSQSIYSSHSAFAAVTEHSEQSQCSSEQWRGYLYTSPQTGFCDHTFRQHLKLLLRKVTGDCFEACIHLPLSRVLSPVQVLLLPNVDELAVHDKAAAPFTLCEAGVVDVNHPYLLLNVLLHA